jgi:hypothetical protein
VCQKSKNGNKVAGTAACISACAFVLQPKSPKLKTHVLGRKCGLGSREPSGGCSQVKLQSSQITSVVINICARPLLNKNGFLLLSGTNEGVSYFSANPAPSQYQLHSMSTPSQTSICHHYDPSTESIPSVAKREKEKKRVRQMLRRKRRGYRERDKVQRKMRENFCARSSYPHGVMSMRLWTCVRRKHLSSSFIHYSGRCRWS